MVDPDQIEQMLINLVRNAVEAALEPRLLEDSDNAATARECPKPQVTLNWVLEDHERCTDDRR
jgi:signal transduction histidine kinase